MSSGSTDANAEGSLIEDVWAAAYDLKQAIERAKTGVPVAVSSWHRELCARILRETNNGLRASGFKIVTDES